MREPLLKRDPEIHPVTLSVLVGVANAIERESVRRYAALAELMERKGEVATAAAFRVMLDEESRHVHAVEQWASSLGEPLPEARQFSWRLPPELAASFDDVAGSARLTPYRAFAIAVDNEQRAFELYTYLGAYATEPQVAAQAEGLALEELRHASLMRRWRRQAWHRERRVSRALRDEQPALTSVDVLHALLARREAEIVGRHRVIAARLRGLGDAETAQLLDQLADTPSWPVERNTPSGDLATVSDDDPVHLLVAAQEPLEALSETLERVMRTAEGEVFAEAAKAAANVVTRLLRISLQTGHRMQAPQAADASRTE